MISRIWAIFLARTREFYRDKGGLLWNLIFPVFIILGFAFAFSRGDKAVYNVGVYPPKALIDAKNHPFLSLKYIQFTPMSNISDAIEKVRYHKLDMFVALKDSIQYWINENSTKGYLVEKVITGHETRNFIKKKVIGEKIRYVDWLVPGIIAMNMMFSSLFGVGWVIVRYRKKGYLKKLKATPIKAYEFLIGQVISRLIVLIISNVIVFLGTYFIVKFSLNGSIVLLALVFGLGCFCMISLGLIFASRFTNEELVSGLLNFLTWPMMFLSGIWFSLEGLHPWLQKVSLVFPLTHIISAMRAIMIDGAHLGDVLNQIFLLIIMSIIFLTLGALLFKWE